MFVTHKYFLLCMLVFECATFAVDINLLPCLILTLPVSYLVLCCIPVLELFLDISETTVYTLSNV